MKPFRVLFIHLGSFEFEQRCREICAAEDMAVTFHPCSTLHDLREIVAASVAEALCISLQDSTTAAAEILQTAAAGKAELPIVFVGTGMGAELIKRGAEDCVAPADLDRLAAVLCRIRRQKVEQGGRMLKIRQLEERCREIEKEVEQFAYIAGHDLKEPARIVSQYLLLICRRHRDAIPAEAEEFLNIAMEAAERINDMIQDLLEFSRLTTRARPWQLVDMQNALDDALALLADQIKITGADIKSDPLPTVWGEPKHLRELFHQLLENALKFSGNRKPVIQVAVEERENEYCFRVADKGIGIPENLQNEVFLAFRRVNPWAPESGTGMGLAICQKIVAEHGGRISCESELAAGSGFFFSLPRKHAD